MARTKTLERLSVALTADDSELRSVFGRAAKPIEGFRSKLGSLKAVAAPVAGAVAAIGGAALAAVAKTGRLADELLDLSDMTGLTTDQLQEYRRVTNQAGVDTDVVADAAKRLTQRMSTGAEGSADMRRALASLGISAKDAEGNLRPMGKIVDEAITALASMEDETQRNVEAQRLFGRSASELAPVLALGSDEIVRLREEAHEMGLVLSGEQLEAANSFRKSWDSISQQLAGVVTQIGADLAPSFGRLATAIDQDGMPALSALADGFVFVVESAIDFKDNLSRIWIGVQGIVIHAVDRILAALAGLTEGIPFLGTKIGEVREQFAGWAAVEMAELRTAMDDVGAATSRATETIEAQTQAMGRNAEAARQAAAAVAESAQFEEVALLDLRNTVQGLGIAHEDLERVAVASSANINIKASGAFQQMADAVSANAHRVLGAVTQVLNKLSGGGGILGGITGAIGGFISGGPIGALTGFVGGLAEGGPIPRGGTALVGERGPELVTAGVRSFVSPLEGMTLRIDPSSIPDPPPTQSPEAAAISIWYLRLMSAMVVDFKPRGGRF